MSGIKKTVLYLFIAALFLCFSQLLPAQSIIKPYYQFKTFTTDDGLSSNNVNCVFKDSKGFLWIGTDRGVQRFNGSSFISFRHLNADSNSINNENISSVTEDSHHDIWIATMDGVAKFSYSNGRLTNYHYGYKNGHAVPLKVVSLFFEDSRGRQWIGTVKSGLYLFDKTTQQFINYTPAPYLCINRDWFRFIANIQETEKQELIFSVEDGAVLIDTVGKQQYIKVPVPDDKKIVYQPCMVLPPLKNHPDEIWITSYFNGLFKYTRSTKKWEHYFADKLQSVTAVGKSINQNSKEWLVCFNNSVYIFNHRTGVLLRHLMTIKLMASKIFTWIKQATFGWHQIHVDCTS
jgi:ligand-binding sensor domain-containing protein